jgi:hypothetical protein
MGRLSDRNSIPIARLVGLGGLLNDEPRIVRAEIPNQLSTVSDRLISALTLLVAATAQLHTRDPALRLTRRRQRRPPRKLGCTTRSPPRAVHSVRPNPRIPGEEGEFLRCRRALAAGSGGHFFLYTDGVCDGSDKEERQQLEGVMRERYRQPAQEICNALLEYAVKKDDRRPRLANRTVLTIRPSSSSSGAEECRDKRLAGWEALTSKTRDRRQLGCAGLTRRTPGSP